VSGALPGSVHDMKAAWIWGIERELASAALPISLWCLSDAVWA
jgi:hypothetical protein